MHVLFALQTAFSLWMLVDAVRRGAPQYWWLIVLIPFGEWAYFFAVFLPNQRYGQDLKRKWFTRRITIDELRRNYRQTPSQENLVCLAQGLHATGAHREAGERFREVLARHPEDRDALYGYASCALAEKETDAAIDALERLIELDMAYGEFVAVGDLAGAYWGHDRKDDAIALLEGLCKRSQRIGPRVALARCLMQVDRSAEARSLLKDGLETYVSSPKFVRRRDRHEARAARALLAKLPSAAAR